MPSGGTPAPRSRIGKSGGPARIADAGGPSFPRTRPARRLPTSTPSRRPHRSPFVDLPTHVSASRRDSTASALSTRVYGTRDCLVPSLVRKWHPKLKLLLSVLEMRQTRIFIESTRNCVRRSMGRTSSERGNRKFMLKAPRKLQIREIFNPLGPSESQKERQRHAHANANRWPRADR